MSRRHYINDSAVVTLTGSIGTSNTTLTVTDASSMPSTFPWTAVLDAGTATAEVVLVTGATGATLTITRAYDGTAAQAHANGGTFSHDAVKADYDEANAHVNATTGVHGLTGAVVGTSDTQTLSGKTLASPTITGTITGPVAATGAISGTTGSFTGALGAPSEAITGASTAASYTATGTVAGAGVTLGGQALFAPQARAVDRTTSISVPNSGGTTPVSYNIGTSYNVGSITYSAGVFTVGVAGLYRASMYTNWPATTTTYDRVTGFQVNGSSPVLALGLNPAAVTESVTGTTNGSTAIVSTELILNAADAVQPLYGQNSSGALTVTPMRFSLVRIA